jgi:hypothetical protein
VERIKWIEAKLRTLDIAEVVDAHRVFPKTFMLAYFLWSCKVGFWFMALEKPTAEQSAFATLVTTTFGLMLNWYMQTGRKWQKEG